MTKITDPRFVTAISRDKTALSALSEKLIRELIRDMHDWTDDDRRILSCILSNSFTPANTLLAFSDIEATHSMVGAFLRNKNLPDEAWMTLGRSDSVKTRRAVYRSTNIPENVIERLIFPWSDKSRSEKDELLRNKMFPKSFYEKFVWSQESHSCNWVASDSETSSELLRRLSYHPDNNIRYHVARNPNTPVSTLEELLARETQPNNRVSILRVLRNKHGMYADWPDEWLQEQFDLHNWHSLSAALRP